MPALGYSQLSLSLNALLPDPLFPIIKVRGRPPFRVVRGGGHQHADPPFPFGLLRPRPERPCCHCPAEQRDELAPFHSITSSARPSGVVGTLRPMPLPGSRLILEDQTEQ